METSAKKVLISGYIGFNNFGDEAIFEVLKKHLQDKNYTVSVLSNKPYDVKTYPRLDIINALLNCDILISGGGSLLQNKTSNKSLIYYLLIIFLAKIMLRKTVIFAQGIEPIRGVFYKNLTVFILKLCDFVSVRDKKSYDLLKSWGIEAQLLSDPIYHLLDNLKRNEEKDGLIIQLRDVKNMNKGIISELASLIKKYYQGKISVLALQKEYDEKICLDFIEKLKQEGLNASYILNEDIYKTIDIINSAKYVISTRLHGLITASSLGAGIFALSYDDKIDTLIEELGLNNINLYNYTYDELDNKLKDFFSVQNSSNKYQHRVFDWQKIDEALEIGR